MKERSLNTTFNRVMETAPLGLLISAALGLLIVGVFQYIFYLGTLPPSWSDPLRAILSGGLAAFFEGLGFYFLVATVRDFSAGHRREGFIGLAATFLLWAYALWEAHHISAAFDGGGKYWAIMGIIGTIVCVVRVVELRITLTVTSAVQRYNALDEAANTIASLRQSLEAATGKVEAYEAAIRNRQREQEQEAERLRQLEIAESARQQREELEDLRRALAAERGKVTRLEKAGAGDAASGRIKVDAGKVRAVIADFIRKNKTAPTQGQVAKLMDVSERSLRNHFPNGSYTELIESLTAEIATT